MQQRKQKEAEFHDQLRDEALKSNEKTYKYLTSNLKFYLINRRSRDFVREWLVNKCGNKKVLDYCCGNGDTTVFIAKSGAAESVGIDISPVSIDNCKKKAETEGVSKNTSFLVMDAEKLTFPDNYFDIIVCNGVLHHLDIEKSYKEFLRVLKPEGIVICNEPIIHNPVFQLYRKMTPHLRTEWETEHILSKKDIKLAEKYFDKVEINFFHLATLFAVPLCGLPGFNLALKVLEGVDSVILRLPGVKWMSWQVVYILSGAKKVSIKSS